MSRDTDVDVWNMCYTKTLHLLIILNPSRQIWTDSYCHLETLRISGDETQIPNSLLDRPGKRDNVARRTTAEYDGLVDPSHYLL